MELIMPYKDREKQRTYQREWVRHKRHQGSTSEPIDVEPVEPTALDPNAMQGAIPIVVREPEQWTGPLTKERQVKGFNK